MFVAHIFAGYLLTRQIVTKRKTVVSSKQYYLFGIFCSILPDIDLLYFYTIDHRQHIHHSYWTHIPIFWISVTLMLFLLSKLIRKNIGTYLLLLLANTLAHLLLDSVAGGIFWFYPLSEDYVRWFHIPSRFDWWVWNYIFHWTFLLEISIIASALLVFYFDNRREKRLQDGSAANAAMIQPVELE